MSQQLGSAARERLSLLDVLDHVAESKQLPVGALLRLSRTCKGARDRLQELGFDYGVTTLLVGLSAKGFRMLPEELDRVLHLSPSQGRRSTGWTREIHDFIVRHKCLSRDSEVIAGWDSADDDDAIVTNSLSSLIKSALFEPESGRLCRGARMLARVGLVDDMGWTDLHRAVVFGPPEGHGSVEDVLRRPDCPIGAKASDDGATAMHLAARKGGEDAKRSMEKLRIAGETVHVTDVQGYTPLSWAAMGGHEECLSVLHDWDGGMIMALDKHGKTPLMLAIERGGTKKGYSVIEFLVTKGGIPLINTVCEYSQGDGDEDYRLPENGWNALMFAAENGDIEIVKYIIRALILSDGSTKPLLEHIVQQGMTGDSAYFIACVHGHLEVVKLLDNFLDDSVLMVSEMNGYTPLRVAAEGGHIDVVKHLIRKGGAGLIGEAAMRDFLQHGEAAMSAAINTSKDDRRQLLWPYILAHMNMFHGR